MISVLRVFVCALAEFSALKEECASLRVRIQDIESEMKK